MNFTVEIYHCVSEKFRFWVTAFPHWKRAFLEFFHCYNDKIQASCESYHQNKQGSEVFLSFIDFYIMSQNVNFCVTQ